MYNLDLTSSECLKLALSKVLGLGMVAGGAILKLPQILTVVRSGSARGLSLSSYVLDTVATGITASVVQLYALVMSSRPTDAGLLV